MINAGLSDRVAAVRRFNRFYTQRIGLLQEGVYKSDFPLTHARVLYEIIHRDKPTAAEIAKDLGLDTGYLSRILRGFEARGLIVRETAAHDGRQNLLSVTPRGRKSFAPVEAETNQEVAELLTGRSDAAQIKLVDAMATIETLLGPQPQIPYILRPPRPGDMGWIVSRHGAIYSGEYGWNDRIESYTAEVVAAFMRKHDPQRERCWIAERAGQTIGCVFLVADEENSEAIARLRLLLVEAEARGLGIGARLVDECIRLAREARYRKITLWTHSILTAARSIYQRAGFKLVATKAHNEFGPRLVGETWELEL
jgi:DNA-binding MarR family transcriptional regulator/GNAT superfamily N-acetyltransferase